MPASSSRRRGRRRPTIERVDPAWISAVARIADSDVDAVAGRWIDLVEEELGELPREEKPWIRDLAGAGRRLLSGRRPRPGRRCSHGRCGDRAEAPGPRRLVRRQPAALGRWTAIHAGGDYYDLDGVPRGRHPDPAVRDRADRRRRRARRSSTSSATSASTRCRGRGSARASPAPTCRRRPIALARELAADLGFADARFVESNLYDLPANLEGTFDIVYTSRGVLGWLPDIRGWARVVAHFLAPGGMFYISEVHPVVQAFENEGVAPGELRLAYPYWEHREPLVFEVKGSYADPTPMSASSTSTAGTTASARS